MAQMVGHKNLNQLQTYFNVELSAWERREEKP